MESRLVTRVSRQREMVLNYWRVIGWSHDEVSFEIEARVKGSSGSLEERNQTRTYSFLTDGVSDPSRSEDGLTHISRGVHVLERCRLHAIASSSNSGVLPHPPPLIHSPSRF